MKLVAKATLSSTRLVLGRKMLLVPFVSLTLIYIQSIPYEQMILNLLILDSVFDVFYEKIDGSTLKVAVV